MTWPTCILLCIVVLSVAGIASTVYTVDRCVTFFYLAWKKFLEAEYGTDANQNGVRTTPPETRN